MDVHRCRFVPYKPEAVNCLALNKSATLLAVARADCNIEIWNIEADYYLQSTLKGSADASIEYVIWSSDNRLFAAGLNGKITEWDVNTLQIQNVTDSFGGAVWCLSVNNTKTRLLAGCEDGCVRLFNIELGCLEFMTQFDRQKTRILSVAWCYNDSINNDGNSSSSSISSSSSSHQVSVIAGGANSCIYKFNEATGRTQLKINLEEVNKETSTLVWALGVLKGGYIVSCDSMGYTQFWDSKYGTLVQAIQTHSADIVSMVVADDGLKVYCSGIDNKIVCLKALPHDGKSNINWIKSGEVRAHTHDVRALALHENMLVSGGVDTNLIVYNAKSIEDNGELLQLSKKRQAAAIQSEISNNNNNNSSSSSSMVLKSKNNGAWRRIPPFPHTQNLVTISKGARLMLYQGNRQLQIWKLGNRGSKKQPERETRALLDMKVKERYNLLCSSISHDGKWIVYSSKAGTKLFYVNHDSNNDSYTVKKVSKNVLRNVTAYTLTFSQDSEKIIATTFDGKVYILNMSTSDLDFSAAIHLQDKYDKQVMDNDNNVDSDYSDSSSDNDSNEHHRQYQHQPGGDGLANNRNRIVKATVSNDASVVALLYSDNKIIIFDLLAYKVVGKLPVLESTVCAFAFQPGSNDLSVSCVCNRVYIFSIKTLGLTNWSRKNSEKFPVNYLRKKQKTIGIAFSPKHKDVVFLYDHSCFSKLDLGKPITDCLSQNTYGKVVFTNQNKKSDIASATTTTSTTNTNTTSLPHLQQLYTVAKYQPLLYMDFIPSVSTSTNVEMVIVERPWLEILGELPAPLLRVRYGM